jgi:hypothetical protein
MGLSSVEDEPDMDDDCTDERRKPRMEGGEKAFGDLLLMLLLFELGVVLIGGKREEEEEEGDC